MESLNGKVLWQFIFRDLHFVSFLAIYSKQ